MNVELIAYKLVGEGFRFFRCAAEDSQFSDRPDRGMGTHEMRCQCTCTDDGHDVGIFPGEVVRGECRGRRRAAARQLGSIHHRDGVSRFVVDEEIARLDRRQTPGRVVGFDHHGLEAGMALGPRRHEEQGRHGRDLMMMPDRRRVVLAEGLAQRFDDVAIGRSMGNRFGRNDLHGPAIGNRSRVSASRRRRAISS